MINFRDEEQPFFIYAHYRNDTGQPFYIGRGKKRSESRSPTINSVYERAFSKKDRGSYWSNVVSKYGYTVEILLDNLTYEEANEKEIEFIARYGRKRSKTGILVNMTDGGEGNVGCSPKESTRKLLSEINTISLEKALFDNSYPCPITGCHHWAGSFTRGRAYINQNKKSYPAAKFLYEHYNSTKLKKGQLVFNSCKNTNCVNPDHFELGDYKTRKKPHRSTYRQHRQVLTESVVREIRAFKSENPSLGPTYIAKKFGFSLPSISQMLSNKCWKWVV